MQQINLYQPVFRKRRILFSAVAILQIAAVALVGMIIVFGFEKVRLASLEKEQARLEQHRDTLIARMAEISGQLPEQQRDEALHVQLKNMISEQKRKLEAVRLLSQGDELGNTVGFSGYLEGLARNTVDGVWLTSVLVNRAGKNLTLNGAALSEALLPDYLTKLSNAASFTGTEFQRVELQRDESKRDRLVFRLSTSSADVAEASK